MGNDYRNVFKFIKGIKKTIIKVGIAFMAILALGIVFFYSNQAEAGEIIKSLSQQLESIQDKSGFSMWWYIFSHNACQTVLYAALGVIPFLFIPALMVFSNSYITGAVLAFQSVQSGYSLIKLIGLGILPHGIFELPALFLALSMGIYLCKEITKGILKKPHEPIIEDLNNIAMTYVLIEIPLLLLASLVETFITPMLLETMM